MQRNGAGVTYLNVFHPDIVEFLSTKKENADEKIRVKTLSLGVVVPDKYYELVEQNKFMHLFSPRDVEREYGMPFSYVNITEEYDNMVANNNIKKYKIDARELEQEISKLQQESGYPYVINIDTVNDANPVNGEILGSNLCVHGDTKILTKQGYLAIRDLAGSKAEVWNGKEWSEVDVVQTNSNQELLNIKTDGGYEVKTTPYHKFYVVEKTKTGKMPRKLRYKEVRAGELEVGDALIKFDLPVINGDKELEFAYDNGFYSGDGATYANGRVRLDLYGEKKSLQDKISSVEQWSEIKISEDETRLSGTARGLKEKFFVPTGEYSIKSKLSWLAGYLDADGTVANNNGSQTLQAASINKEFLKEVQLMLQTLGVDSKVTRNKAEGVTMLPKNDGTGEYKEYKTKEIYRILINGNSLYSLTLLGLECNRLSWELKEPNRKCSRFVRVTSVEEVEGLHDTFCFNEPKRHMGMFNGLLTGNCSEIFQVQSPSVIRSDQSYEQLGVDIVCNLGSSIMSNLIDADNFALSVETMIRGLSNVSDEVDVKEVPTIQNGNNKYHAVGLGVMDAHGAMAKHGIFYGEDDSLEMVEAYFSALRYQALKASMNIAIEKNERFFEFDKSAYADGTAFDHIIKRDFKITSPKVKEIMSKVPVPTKEDWIKLAEEIKENGLYNAYLLALAPTGSISYVRGVTASLQPIVQKVEERQEGKTGKTFYPAPYMEEGALPYYKSAYEIDMRKMIDIYAVAQKYVDQGMSLTLFMPSEIPAGMYEWKPNGGAYTTRDLSILRNYAWNSGIKSIYYVRTFTQDGEVSNVNMCESCSV